VAAAERITRGYLGPILQLTLLAPDIVELIKLGHTGAGQFACLACSGMNRCSFGPLPRNAPMR
jgi:hypothetical protein